MRSNHNENIKEARVASFVCRLYAIEACKLIALVIRNTHNRGHNH